MFSQVLRGLYGALRVVLCVFTGFTVALRSSTAGLCLFRRFYERSTELLRVALCGFQGFTRGLRSSTGSSMCFRRFYEGSTELYGWRCVFSYVLREFYGALRVVLHFLRSFIMVLWSSTGGSMCFRRFYEGSTELYGWTSLFSMVLRRFY